MDRELIQIGVPSVLRVVTARLIHARYFEEEAAF